MCATCDDHLQPAPLLGFSVTGSVTGAVFCLFQTPNLFHPVPDPHTTTL